MREPVATFSCWLFYIIAAVVHLLPFYGMLYGGSLKIWGPVLCSPLELLRNIGLSVARQSVAQEALPGSITIEGTRTLWAKDSKLAIFALDICQQPPVSPQKS
jgi:hypothetical protein